jgi:hypothetical protein
VAASALLSVASPHCVAGFALQSGLETMLFLVKCKEDYFISGDHLQSEREYPGNWFPNDLADTIPS